MKRILLVNPNTNAATTASMLAIAREAAAGLLQIEAMTAPEGVPMITDTLALQQASQVLTGLIPELRAQNWDGVITAAALIAFEKGRSWPRARTRARLEEVLQWQPGAIDRIRRGESTGQPAAPPSSMDEPTLLAAALTSAAHALTAVVDALPPADDPQFGTRVTATLADLRQLEAVASKAARVGPPDPDLLRALAAIRRHYDELMRTAANGPDATLGQRVYSVRRLNALTDAEMARACGVSDDVVVRAQAALPLTAEESATLETAVARLNWT
jgi:hypothetical protein